MPVNVRSKIKPLAWVQQKTERVLRKFKKKTPYQILGEELPDDVQVTPTWVKSCSIGCGLGSFFILNYVGTILYLSSTYHFQHLFGNMTEDTIKPTYFSLYYGVLFYLPWWVYVFLIPFCSALGVTSYKKLSFKFRSLVRGQKGDNRLATIDEIKQQYKAIPDKTLPFPGIGGVPITHYKGKYYIDTNTINTLYIGTSRSGKDEIYAVPKIDILSRAEQKVNMVVNDVKGEMLAASKQPLEERGYEVFVLNLMTPHLSMGIQLVNLIIYYWRLREFDTVQLLVNSLTFSLYHDPKATGTAIHFNETAQGLVSAVLLALLEENSKLGQLHKVTMYNVAQFVIEMGNWNYTDPFTKKTLNALDEYFKRLPAGSIAKGQYASTSFAEDRERGSILSTAMRKLNIFQIEAIAKMTSTNSLDFKRVGFPKDMSFQFDPILFNQMIRVSFCRGEEVIGQEVIKPAPLGSAVLNFDYDLQTGDTVLVTYISPENEKQTNRYAITIPSPDKESDRPVLLKPLQNELSLLKEIHMTYHTKPIAVFMLLPDEDKSLHPIASIFVGQLYQALVKNCRSTRGGKCHRRVNFILNELGQMSPIADMATYITAGLGRNILFDLYVQSFSQLYKLFGKEDGETIKDGCQNQIYIMSKNKDTISEIQGLVGKRTVESHDTSEHALSLDNSATRRATDEYLLTKERLSTLIRGETVVWRNLHRADQLHRKIRPYPIFNTKETSMPFRHEFLSKDFDTERDLMLYDFETDHTNLNLDDYRIDVHDFFSFTGQVTISDAAVQDTKKEDVPVSTIEDELKEVLGRNAFSKEDVDTLLREIQEDATARLTRLTADLKESSDLRVINRLLMSWLKEQKNNEN